MVLLPLHHHPYLALSFEHNISKYFIVRAGTRWNSSEIGTFYKELVLNEELPPAKKNDMKLAAGFTLKKKKWAIDYAAQRWVYLGYQHWITLKLSY